MKFRILTTVALLSLALGANAQSMKTVKLNKPNMKAGGKLMEAFSKRSSSVEWTAAKLSTQDLSNLLWAANGINRPDEGKRTAPSAINAQEIDVYVFLEEGAYLYNAKENTLESVVEGDFREVVIGPRPGSVTPTSQPPLLIILVADVSRFGEGRTEGRWLQIAAMDAGIVSQNIGLYCAATGLVTRPRASMDMDKIKEVLKLSDTQHPMLNHPIGYAK